MGKRKVKAMKGNAVRLNSIGATDIRRARGDVVTENVEVANDDGTRRTLYNVDKVQSQLKRMLNRGQICAHQYMAGERFAHDAEMAQVSMKSCLDLGAGGSDGTPSGVPSTVGGSWSLSRARAVLGPLNGVVAAVAVDGEPASTWAERNGITARSGIDFLKIGLSALARHYRLDCDCQSAVSATRS